jgi:2,3-bisphosphoglycerate-dependent phosphoglycerate mutase/probable phosphoglycerate mutase
MSATDRPLTPFGKQQAKALGTFFATRKIDVIVHTGLARTFQVAQAIASERRLLLVCDEQWRETSHGAWEGLTYDEVTQRFPDNARQRTVDPANTVPLMGESLAGMSARVRAAWERLGQQYPNQRIVVITHATPIQAILCMLTNVPLHEYWRWRVDLGSASGVDCYPAATILRGVNIVPHIV